MTSHELIPLFLSSAHTSEITEDSEESFLSNKEVPEARLRTLEWRIAGWFGSFLAPDSAAVPSSRSWELDVVEVINIERNIVEAPSEYTSSNRGSLRK